MAVVFVLLFAAGFCWRGTCVGPIPMVMLALVGAVLGQRVMLRAHAGAVSRAQKKWAAAFLLHPLVFVAFVGGCMLIWFTPAPSFAKGVCLALLFNALELLSVQVVFRLYARHVQSQPAGGVLGDQRMVLSAWVGHLHCLLEGLRLIALLVFAVMEEDSRTWAASIPVCWTSNVLLRTQWMYAASARLLTGPPTARMTCHNAMRWYFGYIRFVGLGALLLFRLASSRGSSPSHPWYFNSNTIACVCSLLGAEVVEDAVVFLMHRLSWVPKFEQSYAAEYAGERARDSWSIKLISGQSFEWRPMPVYLVMSSSATCLTAMVVVLISFLGPGYILGNSATLDPVRFSWPAPVCHVL